MFLFSCSSSVSGDDEQTTEVSEIDDSDSARYAFSGRGGIGGHDCGNKSSLSR